MYQKGNRNQFETQHATGILVVNRNQGQRRVNSAQTVKAAHLSYVLHRLSRDRVRGNWWQLRRAQQTCAAQQCWERLGRGLND